MKEKRAPSGSTQDNPSSRFSTSPTQPQLAEVRDPAAVPAGPDPGLPAPGPGGGIKGTSLWGDARRRLLKNKLAVFGLVFVTMIVFVSLAGPAIIVAANGYTYDFIPT